MTIPLTVVQVAETEKGLTKSHTNEKIAEAEAHMIQNKNQPCMMGMFNFNEKAEYLKNILE